MCSALAHVPLPYVLAPQMRVPLVAPIRRPSTGVAIQDAIKRLSRSCTCGDPGEKNDLFYVLGLFLLFVLSP